MDVHTIGGRMRWPDAWPAHLLPQSCSHPPLRGIEAVTGGVRAWLLHALHWHPIQTKDRQASAGLRLHRWAKLELAPQELVTKFYSKMLLSGAVGSFWSLSR